MQQPEYKFVSDDNKHSSKTKNDLKEYISFDL